MQREHSGPVQLAYLETLGNLRLEPGVLQDNPLAHLQEDPQRHNDSAVHLLQKHP